MVTSAKSLHSLLDRPDIAAERGRLLSAERRQEPSLLEQAAVSSGCGGNGRADVRATGGGQIGVGGGGGGVIAYKRGGVTGAGGHGGHGTGGAGRPLWKLGGVQEGPADDEGGGEGEEGGAVDGGAGAEERDVLVSVE